MTTTKAKRGKKILKIDVSNWSMKKFNKVMNEILRR